MTNTDETPDQIELSFSDIHTLKQTRGFEALIQDAGIGLENALVLLESGIKNIDGKKIALTESETWYFRGFVHHARWLLSYTDKAYTSESQRLQNDGHSDGQ